ncbi:MAG TPA: hypothetical protein VF867_07180 [Arthrobacter sp.]
MTAESLLAAYSAWLLAWMAPLWLLSFLYRSVSRTIACYGIEEGSPAAVVVPARPLHLPRIHLAAA